MTTPNTEASEGAEWEREFAQRFGKLVDMTRFNDEYAREELKLSKRDRDIKAFIATLLQEREEAATAKWKALSEAMTDAPVGHRVVIEHDAGSDEWTLTRRTQL